MVLEFLGEAVSQAGEAAHVHPHGQVRPLDVRGADVRRVGGTFNTLLAGTDAQGRAVAAPRALRNRAIELLQDGIINVSAKRALRQ